MAVVSASSRRSGGAMVMAKTPRIIVAFHLVPVWGDTMAKTARMKGRRALLHCAFVATMPYNMQRSAPQTRRKYSAMKGFIPDRADRPEE